MVVFLVVPLCLLGCANSASTDPESKKQLSPADFFPLTQGSRWEYAGEGNEYAPFVREIQYVNNDRAQLKDTNPGASSISIYRTTDKVVTRVFFEGEAYEDANFLNRPDEENTIILQAPLKVGTKWEAPNAIREIVAIDAQVDTPVGLFEDCIKVEISFNESTSFEYYKNGIGLVKREFTSGNYTVTSTLEAYNIKEN